ncbi:hypothetical protein [Bradyrhizobium yuanmingense]|uniref:hypothetical protein n=1 Tax=Bradyrhizobium yuanmingense TaxID=108015 RepID=UPI0018DF9519|nr:hypothetical protein [Bradyrhizobium yuanmingense]
MFDPEDAVDVTRKLRLAMVATAINELRSGSFEPLLQGCDLHKVKPPDNVTRTITCS